MGTSQACVSLHGSRWDSDDTEQKKILASDALKHGRGK